MKLIKVKCKDSLPEEELYIDGIKWKIYHDNYKAVTGSKVFPSSQGWGVSYSGSIKNPKLDVYISELKMANEIQPDVPRINRIFYFPMGGSISEVKQKISILEKEGRDVSKPMKLLKEYDAVNNSYRKLVKLMQQRKKTTGGYTLLEDVYAQQGTSYKQRIEEREKFWGKQSPNHPRFYNSRFHDDD